MSYGGPRARAVSRWRRSRALRERMAPERGFERRGHSLALFLVVRKRRTAGRPATKRSALCGGSVLFRSRVPGPPPAPSGATINGAAAARAAPWRCKARCHGAQARPRGASLGPLPPHSAPWGHPGTSMRRHGTPIAQRRARSRAAEHPKMAARAASAARAGVAEAKKVSPTPNATQGRKFRSPTAPSAPWGRLGA